MKRTVFWVFIVCLTAAPIFASPPAAAENPAVYITRSGAKYHTEDCPRLKRSKIEIPLNKAALTHEPCSQCKPPTARPDPNRTAARAQGKAEGNIYKLSAAGLQNSREAETSRMLTAKVAEHIDGDTVRLLFDNPPPAITTRETVRLLGVDTPETVHPKKPVEFFGKEASDFTKTRLLGKNVYIAFDRELRDRYGRLLVYIYTGPGECFNAEIIRQGYAHAYLRFPFQFMDEFKELQREAREKGLGLWGKKP
jgi:micrococcal nuclease